MIKNEVIAGKQRVVVNFNKDIFISTFNNDGLDVLISLTDDTEKYQINGKLDLDKDYYTSDNTLESLNPKVILKFNDPRSITNMILLLQDAEKLLSYKLPKRRTRHGWY